MSFEDRKRAVLDRLDVAALCRELLPSLKPAGPGQGSALCPYHDDRTPSFSIQAETGLFHCFACGEKGNLFDLAGKVWGLDFIGTLAELERRAGIAAPEPRKAEPPARRPRKVAEFPYTDAAGKVRYLKERWEPGRDGRKKEFYFYHFAAGKKEKGRGGKALLYRLPDLAAAPPGETAFFLEGEAHADAVARLTGCPATSLDSGAQSGKSAFPADCLAYFKGRPVIILPDNDAAGEAYLSTVAGKLAGVAASIRVLRLPGLSEKGDVLDWIAAQGNAPPDEIKARFLALADAAEPWSPPPVAVKNGVIIPPAGDEAGDAPDKNERGAARLLALLDGPDLFNDDSGLGYIRHRGRLYQLDAKNKELVEELALLHWDICGKNIAKEGISNALLILAAQARRDGKKVTLFNRIAEKDGAIWVDLGTGRAARIAPGGWSVVSPPPVLFRYFSHQLPHPDPVPGGNPWKLFDFLNVPESARLLFLVAVAACFVPGIAHPLLCFTGPQGAGKTFAARLVKVLVDSTAIEVHTWPRKDEDFDLLLWRYAFLIIDNLSSLTAAQSDRICTHISGGAIEKRTLHTDLDATALKSGCILAVTSITAIAERPDLAERSIKLELERIAPNARRTERRLLAEFAAAIPEILGGIFDLLAAALEIFPTVDLEEAPRMADFAAWGFAIGEALGGRGREFLEDYAGNARSQTADLLESNTLFGAIVAHLETEGELSGTFKEVVETLKKELYPPDGPPPPKDWSFPTPRTFRKALLRLQAPLDDMGIGFEIAEQRSAAGKARVTFTRKGSPPPAEDAPPITPDPENLLFDDAEIPF